MRPLMQILGIPCRGLIVGLAIGQSVVLSGCESQPSASAVTKSLMTMSADDARARFADPSTRQRLRDEAIVNLMGLAANPDPQVRANAVEALLQVPEEAEPVLAARLRDDNLAVRSVAAMGVGKLKMKRLTSAVQPLLDDTSPYVRASAIFALRRCGVEVDPSPLAGMALRDPSLRVRAHAVVILGELGDPSALGLLRQAAKDPLTKSDQAEVRLLRLQIAEAMVKLGDDDQIEPIRAALYPSLPDELEATALAVQIIGQVGDRAATNQLIYLALQKNEANQTMPAEIRLGVAGALAKLGKPEGSFVAEEFKASNNPALRAQAAYVYGQTGQVENLTRLEGMMADSAASVRVSAAGAVLVATKGDWLRPSGSEVTQAAGQ